MNVRRYNKFIVALGAAVAVLVAAAADGTVTASELVQVVLAVLGALGVYVIPNAVS